MIPWPSLPLTEWQSSCELLHLLSQIVGKIKLQLVPFRNHWWNITFLPSVNGFTTGIIPYKDDCFEMEFDFIDHQIILKTDDGQKDSIELKSGTVHAYYAEIIRKLQNLGIFMKVWPVPVEMETRVPFDKDDVYREYHREEVDKFRKIITKVSLIMEEFRCGFKGKASPVHFFWGAFDMAVTFFSGKSAPEHPGVPNVGRKVMAEAYNAELASFGFWPGMGFGEPAFYSYSYPEPSGYSSFPIKTPEAYYHPVLKEFILPYTQIIRHENTENLIMDFFLNSYKAAEQTGQWSKKLSFF